MENSDAKNLYELAFWISPDFKDEEAKKYLENIKNYIKELGGELKKELDLNKKKLAYKINKKSFGYLGVFYLYLDPTKLNELEKKLKSDVNILRFMMISVSKYHLKSLEETKIQQIKTIIKPELTRLKEGVRAKEIIRKKPREDKRVKLEELDKKLEEILGKKL